MIKSPETMIVLAIDIIVVTPAQDDALVIVMTGEIAIASQLLVISEAKIIMPILETN